MTPEERRRAGGAVAERMKELGLTAPRLAEKAGVNVSTVRALINGRRTLHDATRSAINTALDWPDEELARRVWAVPASLRDATTQDLAAELCRRLVGDHGVRH